MIAEDAGIPTHGNAGIRLGPEGVVTTISYSTITDGRIVLDRIGWMHFVKYKMSLQSYKLVLIIMRMTNDPSLDVMIELQII